MLSTLLLGVLAMEVLMDPVNALKQSKGVLGDIPCGHAFPGGSYQWENTVFTLSDERKNGFESNFKYRIGLCQNLAMEDVLDLPQKCQDIVRNNNGVAALQYHTDAKDTCEAIGGHIAPGKNMSWQLVDDSDPSLGASLVYLGGTPCTLNEDGKEDGVSQTFNRALTFDQICAERSTKFDVGYVVEDSTCRYHIVVEGKHGCPLECGRSKSSHFGSEHVCNRKGVCRYDSHEKTSRCYCNDGWGHGNCTSQGSAAYSSKTKGSSGGAVAGGLFGGFFLGLLVAGGVYYYFFVYTGEGIGSFTKKSTSSSPQLAWSSSSAQSTSYVPPDAEGGHGGHGGNDPLL